MTNPICDYFEAGRCRSCALIETPYSEQLRAKEARCRELLPQISAAAWLPSIAGDGVSGEEVGPVSDGGIGASPVRDFRNKAKLVVGGRPGRVTLGILGPDGSGVDLRDCLIQEPGIRRMIPDLAAFIESIGIAPYDVPRRRGELKFVHVTISPGGELMLRFVTRGEHGLHLLRRELPALRRAIPNAAVISVNLLPEHKAVLEGEREELLLGSSLGLDLGGASLHLLPQSFFQTNTAVARRLYAQAAEWVDAADPASLWDLYCGVGGFALHCAARRSGDVGPDARRVLGVEISGAAVRSARRSARDAGISAGFEAADATSFALSSDPADAPGLVIVNPPRRGIGPDLAGWLETTSRIRSVVYSSCNPESLARDLTAMPSYEVREARVFDMFPHTKHLEVAVLLERADMLPAAATEKAAAAAR